MACMSDLARRPWLRSDPGSYALFLNIETDLRVAVGGLGSRSFPAGLYVYLGSAQGPGGVAARVNRHLRPVKALRWHIDYVDTVAPIIAVSVAYGPERRECEWSQRVSALAGALVAAPGFGAGDCRSGCRAHFWRLPAALPLAELETELTQCPIHLI